jgi:formyltetrahydrofolate deformylase
VSHNVHLLVTCPDRKGLIPAVSSFVEEHNGNVPRIDQYVEVRASASVGRSSRAPSPRSHVVCTDRLKRMAIIVSKYDHCLLDLL